MMVRKLIMNFRLSSISCLVYLLAGCITIPSTPLASANYTFEASGKPKADLLFDGESGWTSTFQVNKKGENDACAWEQVPGQVRLGIFLNPDVKPTPIAIPAGDEVAIVARMRSAAAGVSCNPNGVVFKPEPNQKYEFKTLVSVDKNNYRNTAGSCSVQISRIAPDGKNEIVMIRALKEQSCNKS